MRKQQIFTLIFFLNTFFGVCFSQSLIDVFSMRKPHPEPASFQVSKLQKWNIRPNVIAVFDSNYSDSMRTARYAVDTHMIQFGYFSPIQYRVYKNDGSLFTAWQYCFGNVLKLGAIKDDCFEDIQRLPINRDLNFAQDKSLFIPINNRVPDISDYKCVVIAFWDPYFGRSARKMLQRIQKVIDKNDPSKILFITVNYNGAINVR